MINKKNLYQGEFRKIEVNTFGSLKFSETEHFFSWKFVAGIFHCSYIRNI